MIDQSSCNKDFSCLDGFCPSFVTLEGAKVRKAANADLALPDLPAPELPAIAAPTTSSSPASAAPASSPSAR